MTPQNVGIHVGVSKEAVEAAAKAIIEVATCSPVPEVAITALKVFRDSVSVNDTTVTNCTITMPQQFPVVGSDYRLAGDI